MPRKNKITLSDRQMGFLCLLRCGWEIRMGICYTSIGRVSYAKYFRSPDGREIRVPSNVLSVLESHGYIESRTREDSDYSSDDLRNSYVCFTLTKKGRAVPIVTGKGVR